jgi:hypothetical protein
VVRGRHGQDVLVKRCVVGVDGRLEDVYTYGTGGHYAWACGLYFRMYLEVRCIRMDVLGYQMNK